MDLTFSADQEEFRQEVRDWMARARAGVRRAG